MSLPSAQNLSITIGLRGATASGNARQMAAEENIAGRGGSGQNSGASREKGGVLPGGALVPVFEEPLMRRGTVPRHEVRPQPLDHVPPRNQLLLVQEVVIHEQRVQHLQAHGGS